ncbi:MAG: hypothetical protein WCV88_01165 [Patescibacteria group bacterium]|jgi:hypothetical protein
MFKTKLSLLTTLVACTLLLAGSSCTTTQKTNINTNAVTVNTNTTNDNTNVVVTDSNDNINGVVTNENTNTEQVSEVDTSDWLTYTNDEYGFSFKYPVGINVTVQETDLVSKILPGKKVSVVQVAKEGEILLTIFPERNIDHGVPGLEQKMVIIGGKSGTELFSDISSEYWVNNYPLVDAHFTILSNNTKQEDKKQVELIISTITFNF